MEIQTSDLERELREAEEAPTRMLELLARARTCRRRVA